jgi:hypothetical protein
MYACRRGNTDSAEEESCDLHWSFEFMFPAPNHNDAEDPFLLESRLEVFHRTPCPLEGY